MENQKRVKDLAEKYGPENVIVLLGGAEAESSGLACETVTVGDPTFAGPLAGVSLGLLCYHVAEPEIKSMMEMVMDVNAIIAEISEYRNKGCKFL